MTNYQYNDGGRSKYFKGIAGDCATRAMAIALDLDYKDAYNQLSEANKRRGGKKSARNGISKEDFNNVLEAHGWVWVAAPKFQGRKAYVGDMPSGRVIARMAKHLVAVIDGVAYDTFNSTRKMIYGYWEKSQ